MYNIFWFVGSWLDYKIFVGYLIFFKFWIFRVVDFIGVWGKLGFKDIVRKNVVFGFM